MMKWLRFTPEETDSKNEVYIGSIAIFREGIEPKWEDPKNASGGHFEFNTETIDAASLDSAWELLVLNMISNHSLPLIKEHVP